MIEVNYLQLNEQLVATIMHAIRERGRRELRVSSYLASWHAAIT
jgi:hypothetical protein